MQSLASVLSTLALAVAGDAASAPAGRHDFLRAMNQMGRHRRAEDILESLLPHARQVRNLDGGDDQVVQYDDEVMNTYGFNLTDRAFKYLGCQNIHTYSDDMAQDEDAKSPLTMDRFVVFRLCPRDTCSSYYEYGCQANYGDYMLPMELYMQTMAQYYVGQFAEYCDACYTCAQQQKQYEAAQAQAYANGDDAYNGDDANNNRKLGGYYDDTYGDDAAGDDAAGDDGAANDDGNAAAADVEPCEYTDACENWKSACSSFNPNVQDFEDFFECAQFNVGGKNVGYLGPHCRDDGKTIGIGIYEDQYCSEYVKDLVDLGGNSGLDFDDSYLNIYYSEDCVSCVASEGYDLNGDDNDGVLQICTALYDEAAKCNKHMGDADETSYQSEQQEENEGNVCDFITSLMTNSYDEYGEIVLESESWRNYVPTAKAVQEMTKGQKWGLSLSIISMFFLGIYSCYLHRKISQRKFIWNPRMSSLDGRSTMDTMAMSRMQSGIVQNRSRSGGRRGVLT